MKSNKGRPGTDNGPERDVFPEETPHVTKKNQDWGLRASEIDDIDRSSSSHNQPWPLHKGKYNPNGWEDEMYHTTQTDEVKEK